MKMVETQALNEPFPPPPPTILVHEVETRNEDALKQGEAEETLELITIDQTQLEAMVRIETKMKSRERQ